MSSLWFGLVLGAVLIWTLVSKGRRYARLYADVHLVEISQRLAGLLAAQSALGPADQAHDQQFTTSAGLNVVYGRHSQEGAVLHHLSLSHRDGVMAEGAARTLVAFIVALLGIEPARVEVATSSQLVTHAGFRLSAAENESLVGRSATVIDAGEAQRWLRRAMDARAQLRGRAGERSAG